MLYVSAFKCTLGTVRLLSFLATLQILQFADSALPVGSISHSFGLEALAFDEDIANGVESCPESVYSYLAGSLAETLLLDAVFCRQAHSRAACGIAIDDLNEQMSAFRLARETREASLSLGRRFGALAAAIHPIPALCDLAIHAELHHAVAFGYVLGILAVDPDLTVSAYIHQCVLNTISAAQRLLPLGQILASRIAWDLKPAMLEALEQSRGESASTAGAFAHLPEVASMRHACLPTRLFIS